MRRLLLPALLILAVAAPSQAVLLRYKYKKGQVLHYQMQIGLRSVTTSDALPQPMRMEMTGGSDMTMTTLSMPAADRAVVKVTEKTKMSVTAPGQEGKQAVNNTDTYTQTVDTLGKRIGKPQRQGKQAGANMMEGSFGDAFEEIALPKKDVKPGDRWEATLENGGKVSGKYLGMVKQGKYDCAKLQYHIVFSPKGLPEQGQGTFTGDFTQYFAVKEGLDCLLEGTLSMAMSMTSGPPQQQSSMKSNMKANLRVKLVK